MAPLAAKRSLAVVAVAVALSLLLPNRYTASSSVLIDMKSPDPVAGNVTSIVPPGYMATQADLIQSERVARRAISALRLDTNAELRSDWQEETKGVGDYQAWVATTLAKRLEIKPSRESNVLSISYSSRDPGFSAAVVNAYVKGYVDTTLELKTEPARESNAFFDERAKKFRQELEDRLASTNAPGANNFEFVEIETDPVYAEDHLVQLGQFTANTMAIHVHAPGTA